MVFVGYGVVAPEYGWDDFKGVDVKGKTIVMLINDPAITRPRRSKNLDEKMFKGKAMTYYGRWTPKYDRWRKPERLRSSFTKPVPQVIQSRRWQVGGRRTSASRRQIGL